MDQHPKDVQKFLGHANSSITLDVYSHVLAGMGLAGALQLPYRCHRGFQA